MSGNGEWQIGCSTASVLFLLAKRSLYGLAIFFWGGGTFLEKNGGRAAR
jgi:hypothetical protein